jgi:hypothetical protein
MHHNNPLPHRAPMSSRVRPDPLMSISAPGRRGFAEQIGEAEFFLGRQPEHPAGSTQAARRSVLAGMA